MYVHLNYLPPRASRSQVHNVLQAAEDKLWQVIQVDYKTGMIRFDSLMNGGKQIILWTTTFTIGIEDVETGYVNYRKRQTEKEVNKYFGTYQQKWEES